MRKLTRGLAAGALTAGLAAYGMTAQGHTVGEPGDPTMLVHINDSEAGGSYHQEFELAYDGAATRRYARLHLRAGRRGSVAPRACSLDPAFDQNPDDEFTPCADNLASDYLITQEQINLLGDELANHIVAVDEAHYGDIGTAVGEDGTTSDALVMLVYNVQDESYYDCSVTTYTAGYFAPEYIDEAGHERHRRSMRSTGSTA